MRKYLLVITASIAALIFQSCNKESNSANKTSGAATSDQLTEKVSIVNIDSNLLCYLKFQGNLKDSSGHNNNGRVINGPITYTNDRFGNKRSALAFGTSGAFIEIPEADFDGIVTMTIAMDFYMTNITTRQCLISKMSDSINQFAPGFYQSFGLGFDQSLLGFTIEQEGNCYNLIANGYDDVYSNTAPVANQWYHAAITVNNSIEKLYLNGILVGSLAKARTPVCSGEPIRLGLWWSQDPQHFTGYMDEVRLYNRALSAGDIKQLSKL